MDMHFDGIVFQTHAAELARRMEHSHPPFCVLDLRSAEEFARARIPGALRVSPRDLESALPPGTTEATEFFVVGSGPEDDGVRAAAQALRGRGARRVVELPGGMLEWTQMGLPTESREAGAAA